MEKIALLKSMLELQYKLNVVTCGEKWFDGMTSEERVINWRRYMRMELAELIDSSPMFKHWKDLGGAVKWNNIRMEVVDVWHFLMSEALPHHTIEEILVMCERHLAYPAVGELELDYFDVIDIADELTEHTFDKDHRAEARMMFSFFKLLAAVGMSFEDLYKQYIVKNTLNTFRQNNGYKEDTYVKVIDGEEDNVHIMGIVNLDPTLTPEALYAKYEEFYIIHTTEEETTTE